MKIALAFFGLPRCSPVSFPSIESNLIAPLAAAGELSVRYHLYRQSWIRNPRSGEDHPQPAASYQPFLRFRGEIEDRPQQPPDALQRWKAYGDAWQDGCHSLGNLVLQLQSLLAVSDAVAQTGPDVVVFARPDLLYQAPLPAAYLQHVMEHPDEVLLPRWESWGGYNDRFAVAGARAWRAYGGRVLLGDHFCERTGGPMHAETFLRYAMAYAGVPVRTVTLRANRVRVDGRIEAEDFEGRFSAFASGAGTGPPGP